MSNPIRVQRSRKHKQVSPNGLPIVYCGRPSEFGNPFIVGGLYKLGTGANGKFSWIRCLDEKLTDDTWIKMETVEQCIEWHKEYLKRYPLKPKQIERLKGKNLSCWCKVDSQCHVDALLEIVNQ